MVGNTPFSFHCMICFEEFHPEERYPVVLPCGHTYVCHLCANRLDKCMECRTPLFELVPQPKFAPSSSDHRVSAGQRSNWSSARSGGRPVNRDPVSSPPQPAIKRRLALPKNVVLLSLIEATELASADARQNFADSPASTRDEADDDNIGKTAEETPPSPLATNVGASVPHLHSMGSMLDADDNDDTDEDDEEFKIKMSTSLAVGVCGTYAVAARGGLEIFPNRPSMTNHQKTEEAAMQEEDVESLVRVYHLDKTTSRDEQDSVHHSPEKRTPDMKDPLKLSYGDRVQVVSVDGGWAKLARGYGFVRADKNKLVKVGGSVDRACKLEAMLFSLSNRRKSLRLEQTRIDNQFIRFMNELQHSLKTDEDLTVILADAFSAPPAASLKEDIEIDAVDEEKEEKTSSPDDHHPQKPPKEAENNQIATPPRTSRFACFAGGVFGGTGGSCSQEDAQGFLRSALSTNPEWTIHRGSGSHDVDPDASRLFPRARNPSPSAMRAGAQAWREQFGRAPANECSINFRTGMSGHMALLSTHAHPHQYLDHHHEPSLSSSRSGSTGLGYRSAGRMSSHTGLKMSSHTGLTMTKLPSLQGILSSLTLPAPNTPPRSEADRNQIHQTGSM